MPNFSPTPEQQAVIDAATGTRSNLILQALAGAAKTSTLVMIAEALVKTPILTLAFNAKIAAEMRERLPSNCEALTLNSIGHRTWGKHIGERLVLDKKKSFTNLRSIIDSLKPKQKEELYDNFANLLRASDFGKSAGWVPDGHYTNAKRLMTNDEFFAHLEDEPTALEEQVLIEAAVLSIRQSWKGQIDFNDQIMLPTVFRSAFPVYPLVMVDEAQDLSALNHAMLRLLVRKTQRLIAVGDPCQAIYGFRGAHEDSMSLLQQTFGMEPLTLSISFRCPQLVVQEARWRAPHMQWPEWAIEGEVRRLTSWKAEEIPDHAAIICRNNAPLFRMAVKLLKNGRYPELVGNDIGKSLVKVLQKMGPPDMLQADLLARIGRWKEDKLKKSRDPGKVRDQAECLRVFAESAPTLGGAITYAQHLLEMRGPIQLMTGHKSKGLEFNDVFFLDDDLLDPKRGQDKNLRYVIQTRAKRTLTYCYSDGFVDETELESEEA